MKHCARCGIEKSYSDFYKNNQCRDGYSSYCKDCNKLIGKAQRNPQKYSAPPRKIKTERRCSLCKKIKPLSEFSPKKRKDTQNGLQSRCKSCVRKLQHQIYWRNPEKQREAARKRPYNRERNKIYLNNRRNKIKSSTENFTLQQWLDLKIQYKNTCLRCNKQEPEIQLTPDHILPLSKGGSNSIDNIQPLCLSCNIQKHTRHIDYR